MYKRWGPWGKVWAIYLGQSCHQIIASPGLLLLLLVLTTTQNRHIYSYMKNISHILDEWINGPVTLGRFHNVLRMRQALIFKSNQLTNITTKSPGSLYFLSCLGLRIALYLSSWKIGERKMPFHVEA